MLVITTMLKRVKIMRFCGKVLLFVPRIPIFLFYFLGQVAEWLAELLETVYDKFELKIVKTFKWNDVATEQYKKNPNKFKQ